MKNNNKYFNQNLNMKINYILMRLKLLFLSPIFSIIIILGTILFLVFIVYSSPAMLCDDNGFTLIELKIKLTSELARFRISIVNIELYTDLQDQLKQITRPNFRNFSLEEHYTNMYQKAIREYNQSTTIIDKLEASIKRIEPDFNRPVDFNSYGRVGRGF
jgi:hypothetical protein